MGFVNHEGVSVLWAKIKGTFIKSISVSGSTLTYTRGDGSTSSVPVPGSSLTEEEAFLAAHPPGSYFKTTDPTDPGDVYGGTWELDPSLGAFNWRRIE